MLTLLFRNWPERKGLITPVHVFSSGDEAELFLNGKSQGRIERDELEYRFRWDEIEYQPGELHVVTYKDGKTWAADTVRTTGEPAKLRLTADRKTIQADGYDLSFVTVEVLDHRGDLIRLADNTITFSTSGPGSVVATDNGFQADFTAFPSLERSAFSGKALAIVRSKAGEAGKITVEATAENLKAASIVLRSR